MLRAHLQEQQHACHCHALPLPCHCTTNVQHHSCGGIVLNLIDRMAQGASARSHSPCLRMQALYLPEYMFCTDCNEFENHSCGYRMQCFGRTCKNSSMHAIAMHCHCHAIAQRMCNTTSVEADIDHALIEVRGSPERDMLMTLN